MIRILPAVLAGLGLMFAVGCASTAKSPVYSSNGVAIRGYDPVAYFDQGRPMKGDPAYSARYMAAEWHFASAAHRDAFVSAPERYAPAYGGYCAYAVSQGTTAKIDPDAWAIVDGRLFLNYDADIQARWEADRAQYIADADANWPRLRADR